MSVTMKTAIAIGIMLLFIAIFLSPFLLGFHVVLYPALALTFIMLAIIVGLTAG